jgi:predicted GNAT superfamily acetyltransferase
LAAVNKSEIDPAMQEVAIRDAEASDYATICALNASEVQHTSPMDAARVTALGVVSSGSRGMRLGSLLYDDLFRYARKNAIPLVTCEINIVPPNEPSRLFHGKFGFKELGTQWVANGTKKVSLQAAES